MSQILTVFTGKKKTKEAHSRGEKKVRESEKKRGREAVGSPSSAILGILSTSYLKHKAALNHTTK